MESSLVPPRSGGRSRFSKALPAPPPLETTEDIPLVLPVRKDSLPSRPALPPKDNTARSIPSNMATKVMDAPLPRLPSLPSLSRVNSPPTVMPKRKPVGSGASVKSTSAKSPPPPPPPPPPAAPGSGEISPVESFSSLLSAYGTEDSSAARYSVDTAATKHSFSESSPPKLPPKDSLAKPVINRLERMDIVSPLALPTPVSSTTMATTRQQQPELAKENGQADCPPTPPSKDSDSHRPTTTMSPNVVDNSPTSLTNQSPSQPQLWRRRSLKTDKPLTVPELKLTLSHGSTASSQQVTSSMDNGFMNNELPSLPNPNLEAFSTGAGAGAGAGGDSPILNGFRANLPGRNIRPSPSPKLLPRNPSPDKMGNKKSKEHHDGFSQYAQEVEDSMHNGTFMAPQSSPARRSPEIRRPPTPEYAKDESQSTDQTIYSPVSPMTPPDDLRPLSVIQEDAEATAASASAPTAGPLPGLPPRTSSRPGAGDTLAVNASPGRMALPSSPRPPNRSPLGTSSPATAPAPAGLAPSPAIQPATLKNTPAHTRSTSSISIPATDDGDASTIKAPNSPRPTTSASTITTMSAAAATAATAPSQHQAHHILKSGGGGGGGGLGSGPMSPTSPTAARPGDPAYFPMRHAAAVAPIAPGTVLTAGALKGSQLACLGNHYRFLPSRNEDHPLSCQSCQVHDNAVRFTCAHCAVRICADCRDVLMMNGRDLGKLVQMLKA